MNREEFLSEIEDMKKKADELLKEVRKEANLPIPTERELMLEEAKRRCERCEADWYRSCQAKGAEAANKIFKMLVDVFSQYGENEVLTGYDVRNHLAFVASQFGIEVKV